MCLLLKTNIKEHLAYLYNFLESYAYVSAYVYRHVHTHTWKKQRTTLIDISGKPWGPMGDTEGRER